MELFGLAQRVLAVAGVDDEHGFVRRGGVKFGDDALDFFQFFHQVVLGVQAAGGVDDEDVYAARGGGLQRVVGDGGGIGAGALGDDRDVVARAPGLQLFDGGGAEGVARGEHDFFAFLLEVACQFADGGGFACAVDAGHEDDERFGTAGVKRLGIGGEQLLHVVAHRGFHRFNVFEFFAVDLCGHAVDDVARDFDADVGGE